MKYLGYMADLDNAEIATAAVAEENIEISLVGAGVGGGFDKTSKLYKSYELLRGNENSKCS